VSYFTTHLTTQERGLDDKGTIVDNESGSKPITVELVQGKREELYWDKVPEKVRKQAVHKAVSTQSNTNMASEIGGAREIDAGVDRSTNAKHRKRRRDR
jgi:hypothetical protein